MTVTFAVERFADAFSEAAPLMEKHWTEIARNKQLLTLNPDVKRYELLADALLLITARDEKRLVGYFLWILVTHNHYQHVLVAEEDLHYLLPEFRRGLTGYLFVKKACEAAEQRGAKLLMMREKLGHQHPALMKRLGFAATDITYTRSATEAA